MSDNDVKQPWMQQDGEPNNWFRRFERYKLLGPTRSLLGCANRERVEKSLKKSDQVPGSWRNAAKKWNWDARAEAWDAFIAAREEAEWDEKRKQLRAQEWDVAQKLIEKATQMLVYPLAKTSREEVAEGGKVIHQTTVMPSRWGMRDAAALVEAASKLGRLSSGQATDKHEVDATLKDKREARYLSDEQLEAIALGKDESNDGGDNTDEEESESASGE